jgi:hypothetical protein
VSGWAPGEMCLRITHAQPLVPGEGDDKGRMFPRPLLSEKEAALEARLLDWGDGDVFGEFGEMDGVALGLYTHRIRITSGPDHVCREYLVRLCAEERAQGEF